MKHGWAVGIFPALLCLAPSALLCLAPPALAQSDDQHLPMPDISNHDFTLPPEPEARADDLRLQGKCQQAIGIYRALAAQGAGYELAQYNLGRCLYQTAAAETDAKAAAGLKQEAAEWTIKAANDGLPNAQNGLIAIYLDGDGVGADPVEAGKWSLLYHGNGARRMYGLPDISKDLQARLDSALTAQSWAQAQARAASWSPSQQSGYADR